MTPEEQVEVDQLKQQLRQTEALLKQEQGKRIAVERDSYETKRQAQLAQEQAKALEAETQAALLEASEQMKLGLAISQGIWSLGQIGKAFMMRKVSAARVVFRESQMCILMQQAIDAAQRLDQTSLNIAFDKMKAVIATIKQDGEASRLAAIEASLSYGVQNFTPIFDKLISEANTL